MAFACPTDHFGTFPFPNQAALNKEPNENLIHVGSLLLQTESPLSIDCDMMVEVEPSLKRFERVSNYRYGRRDIVNDWKMKTPRWYGYGRSDIKRYAWIECIMPMNPPIRIGAVPSLFSTGHEVVPLEISHDLRFDAFQDLDDDDILCAPLKYFLWKHGEKLVLSIYWDTQSDKEMIDSPFKIFLLGVFEKFFQYASGQHALDTELPDPSMEEPTQVDAQFALLLRDYQQKTLSWMLNLEREKPVMYVGKTVASGDRATVFDLETSFSYNVESIEPGPPYYTTITGGVLADDPGVGKTVTMLSLIHATKTKGTTMVICPANLIAQWRNEAQRCFGESANILQVTTYAEARALQEEEMATCTLFLVSHAFLVNKNYLTKFRSCPVNLFRFPFYRIIVDEIHELADKIESKGVKQYLTTVLKLKAVHRWGMTGTPDFHITKRVQTVAAILDIQCPFSFRHMNFFMDTAVRRSKPILKLPPSATEIIPISMSPEERAIYQVIGKDPMQALMLCSHFSLTDYEYILNEQQRNDLENGTITVQEVSKQIVLGRIQKIEELDFEIEQKQRYLEELTKALQDKHDKTKNSSANERKTLVKSIEKEQNAFQSLSHEKNDVERELLYFETTINLVKNRSEYECVICLEEFDEIQTISLTKCGHGFCEPCFQQIIRNANQPACPVCRRPINLQNVFLVRPYMPDDQNPIPGNEKQVDENKFGTKLHAMATRILSTLKTDPGARFIIFAQFRRLTRLVANALHELKVSNVIVHGTAHMRDRAITAFKEGDVQVILLSAECKSTSISAKR
jgi:SNF2 family DNA or RNA helicase